MRIFTSPEPCQRHGILLISTLLLAGCASPRGEGEITRDPVKVGEMMVQTSYDYSRPEGVAPDSKPVWILPVINSGWKPAKVDSRTGDWVGGHYSATVVEDGKWATLEEAELSGKPYILPGETRPIIPTPLRTQTPGSTGEINATTLAQKLARLDKLERESNGRGGRSGDAASQRSIANQSAIPTSPTDSGRGEIEPGQSFPGVGMVNDRLPPMSIPGVTSGGSGAGGDRTQPAVLGDAPNLPPLPDPPVTSSTGISPLTGTGSSPSPAIGGATPSTLMQPTPTPRYSPETGEILIGVGAPGSTVTVDTPKGPATIAYGQGGDVSVTIKGKTRSIKLQPPENQVKIKLAP